jgi:hypothetical protein
LSQHVSIYFNENIFDTKISEKVDFQFQNWWLLNNDFIMTYAIQESCTFKIGKSAKLMFSEWYLVWLMFLRKGTEQPGRFGWVSDQYILCLCALWQLHLLIITKFIPNLYFKNISVLLYYKRWKESNLCFLMKTVSWDLLPVCCRKCILSPRISLIIIQNLYFMISKYLNSNFGKYPGKLLVKYVTSNHTFLEPDLEQ